MNFGDKSDRDNNPMLAHYSHQPPPPQAQPQYYHFDPYSQQHDPYFDRHPNQISNPQGRMMDTGNNNNNNIIIINNGGGVDVRRAKEEHQHQPQIQRTMPKSENSPSSASLWFPSHSESYEPISPFSNHDSIWSVTSDSLTAGSTSNDIGSNRRNRHSHNTQHQPENNIVARNPVFGDTSQRGGNVNPFLNSNGHENHQRNHINNGTLSEESLLTHQMGRISIRGEYQSSSSPASPSFQFLGNSPGTMFVNRNHDPFQTPFNMLPTKTPTDPRQSTSSGPVFRELSSKNIPPSTSSSSTTTTIGTKQKQPQTPSLTKKLAPLNITDQSNRRARLIEGTDAGARHRSMSNGSAGKSFSSKTQKIGKAARSNSFGQQNDAYLAKYAKQSRDTQSSFLLKKTYVSLLKEEFQRLKRQTNRQRNNNNNNNNNNNSSNQIERDDGDEASLQPSNEFLRSLKQSIRQNTPLTRLSICHAGVNDAHLHVLIESLLTLRKQQHPLKIVEILLNHNSVTDKGAIELARNCLPNLTMVTSVELFGNQLSDDSCEAFSELLGGKHGNTITVNLRRLKLGDNRIGPLGAAKLAEGLKGNKYLSQLHLGGNKIGSEGLKQLAENALMHNNTLTSLGLRDNMVQAEGMKYLAKTLMQSHCVLSDIQLKGNMIGPQGAQHLSEALLLNQSLKVLELQSNQIGPQGTQYLCEALKQNRSVHALNFNDNNLGCQGVEYISELLMFNQSITTLGLANNNIRKKGAMALANALSMKSYFSISTIPAAAVAATIMHPNNEMTKCGCSITGLDLGNNELSNGGAIALSEALRYNNVLTSLDLRQSEIHLKGILSLADMAKSNRTLRHLDLGANYARNQGAIAFADVLAKNSSLTRLCLTDNQVYTEGGEALAIGLQKNYTLRNFSYGGQGPQANRIDSSIRRIIDSIVTENKKHWEKRQQQEQEAEKDGRSPPDHSVLVAEEGLTYPSSNQHRFVNVQDTMSRLRTQQQQQQQQPKHQEHQDQPPPQQQPQPQQQQDQQQHQQPPQQEFHQQKQKLRNDIQSSVNRKDENRGDAVPRMSSSPHHFANHNFNKSVTPTSNPYGSSSSSSSSSNNMQGQSPFDVLRNGHSTNQSPSSSSIMFPGFSMAYSPTDYFFQTAVPTDPYSTNFPNSFQNNTGNNIPQDHHLTVGGPSFMSYPNPKPNPTEKEIIEEGNPHFNATGAMANNHYHYQQHQHQHLRDIPRQQGEIFGQQPSMNIMPRWLDAPSSDTAVNQQRRDDHHFFAKLDQRLEMLFRESNLLKTAENSDYRGGGGGGFFVGHIARVLRATHADMANIDEVELVNFCRLMKHRYHVHHLPQENQIQIRFIGDGNPNPTE